jgi:hypothetical protein
VTNIPDRWKLILEVSEEVESELRRLRAIEAAARAYCDLTPERADETPAPLLFAKLQAALAAKETP